jgi:glucosylglycerate synthase
MATAQSIPDTQPPSAPAGTALLVSVAPMAPEQMDSVFASLIASFPADELLIATPNDPSASAYPALRVIPTPATNAIWPLPATDFVNAHRIAKENGARGILMLGPGSDSLSSSALRELGNAVLNSQTDLAVPHYTLPPHAGLVNSAILYPLTRSLFASRVRFPLAIDLGLSLRMAERLASAGQRLASLNQGDAIMWPVSEATVAGFVIDEFNVGPRDLPQPAEPNINAILTLVTGSLFADIEAKAAFWQRPRRLTVERLTMPEIPPATDGAADIVPMVEAFRLAFTNLQEIWSIVLAPNSLLGLKRLSVVEPASFRMPEVLWARIVFDFLIAYKLRTMNRGHLLGALIPLYLAWVAGHINVTASGTSAEHHIDAVTAAFEADKPYIVSRWRWPDRFNP